MEKFDTWLAPNIGTGATSCFTCAIVNLPAGSLRGTSTAGSNVLHVTEIHMGMAGTNPSVGMPIGGIHPFDSYKNPPPPSPVPVIAGCPNDTCDGSPGDYTLNVPWTVTCRANCGWGLIFEPPWAQPTMRTTSGWEISSIQLGLPGLASARVLAAV